MSFFPVLDLPEDDGEEKEEEKLAVETKRERESILVNLPTRRRHVAMPVSQSHPDFCLLPNFPSSSPIPISVVKNEITIV